VGKEKEVKRGERAAKQKDRGRGHGHAKFVGGPAIVQRRVGGMNIGHRGEDDSRVLKCQDKSRRRQIISQVGSKFHSA